MTARRVPAQGGTPLRAGTPAAPPSLRRPIRKETMSPMHHVNEAVGFVPVAYSGEWKKELR
jgi:hypothetical protein